MIGFIIEGLIGAAVGAAVAKGVSKLREYWNEDEEAEVACPGCGDSGPHPFTCIDRSWAAGTVIGFLTGGIGGTIAGAVAKRVFLCQKCGKAMYEDGEGLGWNADNAIAAFFNYPTLREAAEELQEVAARNQEVAQRHSEEIERLEAALRDAESDKEELETKMRALIAKIQREAA